MAKAAKAEVKTFANGRISFKYTEANRQGECLFFKIVPGTLRNNYKGMTVSSKVIRTGEKEGHEHKVNGKAVQLTMFPETTTTLTGEKEDQPSTGILEVKEDGAKVEHPEHKPLPLKKGKHVVMTQKEATGRNRTTSVRD